MLQGCTVPLPRDCEARTLGRRDKEGMYLPGRQSCQRDHVLGEEIQLSTGRVRKLSPFSEERLDVHLLVNYGRKSPMKGETLWQFQAPVRARGPARIISLRTSSLGIRGPLF